MPRPSLLARGRGSSVLTTASPDFIWVNKTCRGLCLWGSGTSPASRIYWCHSILSTAVFPPTLEIAQISRSVYSDKINYIVFFHQFQDLSLEESGEILGKIGRDSSVSKSDQLHLDIFFSVFFHQLNVYSIDFSQVIDDLPTVLNLSLLFLKLHWPICN